MRCGECKAQQCRQKCPARINTSAAQEKRDSTVRCANYDPGEDTDERKSANAEQRGKKNFRQPRVRDHRLYRGSI